MPSRYCILASISALAMIAVAVTASDAQLSPSFFRRAESLTWVYAAHETQFELEIAAANYYASHLSPGLRLAPLITAFDPRHYDGFPGSGARDTSGLALHAASLAEKLGASSVLPLQTSCASTGYLACRMATRDVILAFSEGVVRGDTAAIFFHTWGVLRGRGRSFWSRHEYRLVKKAGTWVVVSDWAIMS